MADTIVGRSPATAPGNADAEARLRGMWNSVAPAWAEHAPYAETRGAEVAERMLQATAPSPGELVLELACGTGGLGLAAAEQVGPGGTVVVSDFAVEMVSLATARAEARGLDNVTARQLDLDRVDEPDASFDVVLCREGLMFALDPEGAAREITRVLRPGGRFAVAVWGPPASNPWLTVVFDAVAAVTGRTVPRRASLARSRSRTANGSSSSSPARHVTSFSPKSRCPHARRRSRSGGSGRRRSPARSRRS